MGARRSLKVLVIRADRIGDLVLSTPVFQALRTAEPAHEVTALVHSDALPVVKHSPYLQEALIYDPKSLHKGLSGFARLVREIRSRRFDAVVLLQVQFRLALAAFLARVPVRIGPFSKWYSYLFFNKGVFQRRSRVEMHEADYNLMLLRRLGVKAATRSVEPQVVVDAESKDRMRGWLRDEGLGEGRRFVLVHPGMGGSALNWPEGYYIDLVSVLTKRGIDVVVTGSARERDLVDRVVAGVKAQHGGKEEGARLIPFVGSNTHSGLSDFIALESLSSLVVAPSTGPLHLAVALGKPTVSFYPPVKVQSAIRWGPYTADDGRHGVLVPDALCGRDFKCAGKKCPFYFCMERLSVEEAVGQVLSHMGPESAS